MMRWLERDVIRSPRIALCLSAESFNAAAADLEIKSPGEWIDLEREKAVVHTWQNERSLACVVCLHPDAASADPIDVACTLVHEAVHIFQRLCDGIGESDPSIEFEAYSIERISERLMRDFVRQTQGAA